MFGKNKPENLLKEIIKLDTVEFLGVCTVLDISVYKEGEKEEENVEGAPALEELKKSKLTPRDFTDIWSDLCDKVWTMNRRRRRNLARLVYAATKKED